ncbi:transposase [Pyrobaculum islandicum]|uniref:transposase n=1 Tax=Pyrobaculum islandicum TaxID=2277 RepID=UPI001FD7A8D8|nr:transposase [Pyrobaculum islandicum]
MQRLAEVLAEYGIRLYAADERNTSKTCSVCGEVHEDGRVYRGLYVCKKFNIVLNAVGNIAAKLGHKTPTPRKIETYCPTSNGLTPGNGRDPHSVDPA